MKGALETWALSSAFGYRWARVDENGVTTLVIGGPVCKREWILPEWFERVAEATSHAGVSADFVFAVPSWDRDTQEVIRGCKPTAEIIETKEPQRIDQRTWNSARYEHMAMLRNTVLKAVREIGPEAFWSLDSDILPRQDALVFLLEGLETFDAVGGHTWMTPLGKDCPSYAGLKGDQLVGRIDQEVGCFPVDVIMATKLMAPAAYDVDYEGHLMGEDVGWSKACARAGVRLGWQAQAIHKHVMSQNALNTFDWRAGW